MSLYQRLLPPARYPLTRSALRYAMWLILLAGVLLVTSFFTLGSTTGDAAMLALIAVGFGTTLLLAGAVIAVVAELVLASVPGLRALLFELGIVLVLGLFSVGMLYLVVTDIIDGSTTFKFSRGGTPYLLSWAETPLPYLLFLAAQAFIGLLAARIAVLFGRDLLGRLRRP
ncbi:hypothetical protein [Chitinimonas sp. BJYL2]|uniref:hypothetical protein n=1 Tax=Chitinimonas sp. BJYL2 TaxID=2976696 RepID=UPI0022B42C43|nr:hypothetical protein [Chitinimonas sp. BJYL2]